MAKQQKKSVRKKPATKTRGASAARVAKSKRAPKPGVAVRASEKRSVHVASGGDWREAMLERMRALIMEADPEIIEERKWKKPSNAMVGVPVWSREGIVCTGESYKLVVKLTFARGAQLPDPKGLFNASLDGGTRRAIDVREAEVIDARAFKSLVKAAVAENRKAISK